MWSVGCIYAELLQMLDSISDQWSWRTFWCACAIPSSSWPKEGTHHEDFAFILLCKNCCFIPFLRQTLECRSWKNTWQDRGPLFPGSSCYPLSPDRKHRKDPRFHTCLCRQLHQAVLDWMELDAFHPHDLCVEIYKTKHFAHVDTSTSNCLRSFLDVFF